MSLNEYIFKIDEPCLFKNILKSDSEKRNSCFQWTPETLEEVFGEEKFTFRIGKRQIENNQGETQFENQCDYIEAEMRQFTKWVKPSGSETNKKPKLDESDENPFSDYKFEEHWAYADYKYMIELFKSDSTSNRINSRCIDWRSFGFDERNANQSTLWIGSEGAYTPCHFDTYGYNLVAQIYGKKRWVMFAKTDSPFMYPTRVPFEESTVYSKVNIKSPDLERYPLFKNVKPYVVDLEPGDVLYVPMNWWHYVENIETSISINSWIELENEDNYSRLKEIISKMVLQGLMESNMVHFENWLNSSENYSSQEENMELMSKCLNAIKSNPKTEKDTNEQSKKDFRKLVTEHECFSRFVHPMLFQDFIKTFTLKSTSTPSINRDLLVQLSNAATQPNVVDLIAKNLLENLNL